MDSDDVEDAPKKDTVFFLTLVNRFPLDNITWFFDFLFLSFRRRQYFDSEKIISHEKDN